MNHLKNVAGNDVSIFLFRFEVIGNGINFVLNKAIASDMYEDVDEKLKPLAHACCETLVRYKHLSISIREGKMLLQAELYKGQDDMQAPLIEKKKHVFEQVVATVNNCFDENFPE